MTSVQEQLLTHLTPSFLLVVVVSLLASKLLLSWFLGRTSGNLPPGPRGLTSAIGLLRGTFTNSLPELVKTWREQYGPLIYAPGLGHNILFLNTIEHVRELFASKEYRMLTAHRSPTVITQFMYSAKDMVMNAYTSRQRKQRRLFHSAMGVVGEGAERFERLMKAELTSLVEELGACRGRDVQFDTVVGRTLKNILYTLLIGERPKTSSETDALVQYDLRANTIWSAQVNLALTACPLLWWLPNRLRTDLLNFDASRRRMEQFINDHKSKYTPGKVRGVLDTLLEAQGKPGNEWMDDESVTVYVSVIFFGSHVTTRSTLLAVFMYLLNHPEVVRKLQEEIDTVIGDRRPKVGDRPDMSYTEAVVLETLRLYNQEPFMNVRTTRESFQYKGYTIPRNTLIMTNSELVDHDPLTFDDPWRFKPERLLDSRGVLYPPDHPVRRSFQPFGLGARACPGEVFARSRLFLFIVTILQNFDLLPPESEPMIAEDSMTYDKSIVGQVRQVPPFKVRLRPRAREVA